LRSQKNSDSAKNGYLFEREAVKILLIGNPAAVDQCVIELERRGFSDSYAWSSPIPVPETASLIQLHPSEVMRLYKRWFRSPYKPFPLGATAAKPQDKQPLRESLPNAQSPPSRFWRSNSTSWGIWGLPNGTKNGTKNSNRPTLSATDTD
jgi:hypothetical protein